MHPNDTIPVWIDVDFQAKSQRAMHELHHIFGPNKTIYCLSERMSWASLGHNQPPNETCPNHRYVWLCTFTDADDYYYVEVTKCELNGKFKWTAFIQDVDMKYDAVKTLMQSRMLFGTGITTWLLGEIFTAYNVYTVIPIKVDPDPSHED